MRRTDHSTQQCRPNLTVESAHADRPRPCLRVTLLRPRTFNGFTAGEDKTKPRSHFGCRRSGPTRWEESLRSSHIGERTLAASLIAFGVGLAVTPTASADPNADTTPAPAPGPPGVAAPAPGPPGVNAPVPGAAAPAAAACKQFEQAWRFSSKYKN